MLSAFISLGDVLVGGGMILVANLAAALRFTVGKDQPDQPDRPDATLL
jgi:hypothetical protein